MIDDERTAIEHAQALEKMAWRLLRQGRYDDAGTLHDAAACLLRLDDEVSK
jgi:hypothetical protein